MVIFHSYVSLPEERVAVGGWHARKINDSCSPKIQGLVDVPIKHQPTIGDIIANRYLEGDVQNPQKGTFIVPTPAKDGKTARLGQSAPNKRWQDYA